MVVFPAVVCLGWRNMRGRSRPVIRKRRAHGRTVRHVLGGPARQLG